MIIAAHQTMLAPQGAPLPYDAEVEYLESTGQVNNGGPYINTGIIPNANDTMFSADWTPFIVSNQEPMNGIAGFVPTGQSGANSRLALGVSTSGPSLYWGISNLNLFNTVPWSSGTKVENHWIHITGTRATYGYGTSASFSTSISRYNNTYKPIFLFARNAGATPTINPQISNYQKTRVSSAQISIGETVVWDGISVRVGSGSGAVGYFYDRVSGTLFGNAGTGAFTIGPDK